MLVQMTWGNKATDWKCYLELKNVAKVYKGLSVLFDNLLKIIRYLNADQKNIKDNKVGYYFISINILSDSWRE